MAADLVVLAEGRHVGHGQAAVHLGGLVRGHPGVSVGRGVRGRGRDGSSPHAAPTATGTGACTAALPLPLPLRTLPHPPYLVLQAGISVDCAKSSMTGIKAACTNTLKQCSYSLSAGCSRQYRYIAAALPPPPF